MTGEGQRIVLVLAELLIVNCSIFYSICISYYSLNPMWFQHPGPGWGMHGPMHGHQHPHAVNPQRQRQLVMVCLAIVVAVILLMALALGLYYGLRGDGE